ncbi:hypothetical protein GUY44_09990 [Pimelobacter simplex]|nr:hypothetical protein [Pimelobacter simplex]MCG8150809.1 hypothetical protein [Pimelobacter simplex]SFM83546.1 hypothetical protein SAMN05421671_3610 [Pimelobacter simplex]
MTAPEAFPPPPPYAPTPAPTPGSAPVPRSPARSSMVLRHLAGAVIGLVVTPVGILVFDYGSGKYLQERARNFGDAAITGNLVVMALGALILLAVAASARLSGLGPVLAGLVWGGLPFVWYLVDLTGFFKLSRDLPSTFFWFAVPSYLFPLVGALLVGAGLGGRWRGTVRTT